MTPATPMGGHTPGTLTGFHICSFSAVDVPKGAKSGYAEFRAAVLKAGRFSVWHATENQRMAGLYTTLCRDPGIETDNTSIGFPWTLVRLAKAKGAVS